jgi:hypothetical protein
MIGAAIKLLAEVVNGFRFQTGSLDALTEALHPASNEASIDRLKFASKAILRIRVETTIRSRAFGERRHRRGKPQLSAVVADKIGIVGNAPAAVECVRGGELQGIVTTAASNILKGILVFSKC